MQRQTLCLDKHPTEIHMVSSTSSLKSHTEKQRLIKCGRASLTTVVSTYHNFVTLLRNEHIHNTPEMWCSSFVCSPLSLQTIHFESTLLSLHVNPLTVLSLFPRTGVYVSVCHSKCMDSAISQEHSSPRFQGGLAF